MDPWMLEVSYRVQTCRELSTRAEATILDRVDSTR